MNSVYLNVSYFVSKLKCAVGKGFILHFMCRWEFLRLFRDLGVLLLQDKTSFKHLQTKLLSKMKLFDTGDR